MRSVAVSKSKEKMSLSKYWKQILMIVVVISAFAVGRYSAPTIPSAVTTKNEVDQKDQNVKTDSKTVIYELPNGVKQTVIDTTSESITKDVDTIQTQTKVLAPTRDLWNLSATITVDPRSMIADPGIELTRQIVGPFTGSVFVQKSSQFGFALGWSF